MSRTSDHNYYENFEVGDVYQHTRGKTVSEMDNVLLTNMVLNTAQDHFNEENSQFGDRVVYGGINLAIVCGLASEDVAENAIAELGYDEIRFTNPVFHGDTLTAESEVLEKRDSSVRPDGGVVTFEVRGYNQDDEQVVHAVRNVLLKRREYFLGDDDADAR